MACLVFSPSAIRNASGEPKSSIASFLVIMVMPSVSLFTYNVNAFTIDPGNLSYMNEPRTLGERIKLERIRRGFRRQKDLADAIGCTRESVTMWETDKVSAVGGDYLPALARALNVTPEWIQTGEQPKYPPAGVAEPISAYGVDATEGDEDFDPEKEAWVPDVEVMVSAGPGKITPQFVETKYRQRYRLSWFREKQAKPENVRTMRVDGDSMERTLFDGDKIAVDFGSTSIKNGAVYLIVVGQDTRVKRLFRMTDGRIRIVSDNASKEMYPDEYVAPEHMDSLVVLGRVIDKSGGGGL